MQKQNNFGLRPALFKGVRFLYKKLIKPKSANEDLKRREFILNIILLGSIALSTLCLWVVIFEAIKFGPGYEGISPLLALIIFSIFSTLYFLSRKGFFIISAYLLIAIYFVPVVYTTYTYGVSIPQGLLSYALIIIMSGILISSKFAFIMTFLSSSALLILAYLQNNLITRPNLYWRNEMADMNDALVFVITFCVIMIITWLSNREIEKSLNRARASERALTKERDLLEVRVDERTKELKKAQVERMEQLYRSAEFGRLSSGLFHDLVNPLTAVSLNLEQVKDIEGRELADTRTYLARAVSAVKQMGDFILAVRKQIAKQGNEANFSLTEGISQIIQLLSYRARKADVKIIFSPKENIQTFGDPIKFSQIVSNLVSNAIDAYEKIEQAGKRREVLIEASARNGIIWLIVQDWGRGIALEHINKLFEPFFTTKGADKGLGIGLPIAQNITEKDFKGSIGVKTRPGQGTIFIVKIPQKQN